jgi:hypothetical protein
MSASASFAHLVGSVPLVDSETVFRAVCGVLGSHLRRIPDGETGERIRWIWFQREMLLNHPDLEIDPEAGLFAVYQWDGVLLRESSFVRFKSSVDPTTVQFPTGYTEAATASYATFSRLRDEGIIGPDVLFQVSLPTPMATGYMYISTASRDAYLPVYERSLAEALDGILEAIPHGQLSIQWDVCQEVLLFEDYFSYRPDDYKDQVFDQLARLGERVPESVDLGYHLCYGSPADEHLVMPEDTGILAEISNGLASRLRRRLDFIHLPVPKDRTDRDYFRPLEGLELPDSASVIMGLIHHDDAEGDVARITAAREFVSAFGVASECGWGRTDPTRVPSLLASHRRAVEHLNQGA